MGGYEVGVPPISMSVMIVVKGSPTGQPGDPEHHRLIASVADVVRGILDVDPVTGIEDNLLPDRHLLGRTGRAVDSRPRQL